MPFALIIVLPLLGSLLSTFVPALFSIFLPAQAKRFNRIVCTAVSALTPLLALILLWQFRTPVFAGETLLLHQPWLETIGLNLNFRLDGLAYLFVLLILGIGLLVILYAHYYLAKEEPIGRFFSYLLLFMSAMLGVVLSENLLLMLMFWELTSLSSFLLIGFWSHRSDARKGARMALAVTGGGGLALLAGILLLGHITGSFDISDCIRLSQTIQAHPLYPLILCLILLGAFTKSAQFPFHFWLPHAMAAPTPVSAYLHSATMVKAGVFLLARLYPVLDGTQWWFYLVSLTGLTTLLVGSVMAFFQYDLKGLLAYSTISHLGLITLLFGLDTQLSTVAAIFHIINHATFKASLFMAAGIIDHETGTRDMRRLQGLWRFMPHTTLLATVASLAMAGVPLLNGFLSKEMFFAETLAQNLLGDYNWLIPAVATLAATFTVAYSLRFIHDVFFNGTLPHDIPHYPPHEPHRLMRIPMELLVCICLAVGMLPAYTVADLLEVAASATLSVSSSRGSEGIFPVYSLHLWHGFNPPFMMSLVAMFSGVLLYAIARHPLQRWYAKLPDVKARDIFEYAVQRIVCIADKLTRLIENGSLQRYIALLLFSILIVAGTSLLSLTSLSGPRLLMPLDSVTVLGLAITIISTIGVVVCHHHRPMSLVLLSVVGLMSALCYVRFSAPDLALTQLSVEVVTIILLILALFVLPTYTPRESTPLQRSRDALLAAAAGLLISSLAYAVLTRHYDTRIADYYIANSVPGGGGHNIVNVILVDFRGFDTFGEVCVLALAGLGVHALLKGLSLSLRPFRPKSGQNGMPWDTQKHPLMLTILARLVLPLALLVSVFIFLRGHNLPGGGFIAGLITAVALMLQYIASGVQWTEARIPFNYRVLTGLGICIAGLTGIGSWWFGYPFLATAFRHFELPLIGEIELTTAMIFDLGVYLTVIGTALLILAHLGLKENPKEKIEHHEEAY